MIRNKKQFTLTSEIIRIKSKFFLISNHFYQMITVSYSCYRCEDITDNETNFDTHLCGEGCLGHVLPENVTPQADWVCKKCKKVSFVTNFQE